MTASITDGAVRAATVAAEEARSFLASEQGRRLRSAVAGVVIVGAPLVGRLPLVRRSVVGRLLGTAALAAVLVKGAEWVRDWDPAAAPVQPRR